MERATSSDSTRLVAVLLGCIVLTLLFVPLGISAAEFTQSEVGNQTSPYGSDDLEMTERLLLPGDDLEFETAEPDIHPGRSTSTGFATLTARYEGYALDARVSATDTSEEQVQLVQDALDETSKDLTRLQEREIEAHNEFLQGQRTAEELLFELATAHERASILQYRLDRQSEIIRSITPTDQNVTFLRGQISQLHLEAATLQGPVRESVSAEMSGEPRLDQPLVIEASKDGYVTGTVEDGMFLREAHLLHNREGESGGGFQNAEAGRERSAELYPWTFDESVGIGDLLRANTYRASVDHPHGMTTVFVDGGSTLPFREFLNLDLFTVPTVTANETQTGDYTVTIERTYAGGPMSVNVERAGEPVPEVPVYADGRLVGQTDSDGLVRFMAPHGEVELRVVTERVTFDFDVDLPRGKPTVE